MPHTTVSKPLTFYVDSPSVRVFQEFAGESLDKLDEYEAWDIVTILCQAVSLANLNDEKAIDIPNALLMLGTDLQVSPHARKCLKALDGFPIDLVSGLMVGILSVAFEV